MKLLLDTHTFIWWDSAPEQLSSHVHGLLADPQHSLWLSIVSLWEMQIKQQLGKLTLRLSLPVIVAQQQDTNGLHVLPLTPEHIFALATLPPVHKDLFDRILVTQATLEDALLLSRDPLFVQYPVRVVW